MDAPLPPRFLAIGRVAAPIGIRGEVKVEVLTEFPERFRRTGEVYIDEIPYRVVRSRRHGRQVILKLAGIETIEAAERLRGRLVEIPTEHAVPLPPGRYYHYQIIGLSVVTTDGRQLGQIVQILSTGANDVYIVRQDRREILIPAIGAVVKRVDLEKKIVVVEPIPGLLEEPVELPRADDQATEFS